MLRFAGRRSEFPVTLKSLIDQRVAGQDACSMTPVAQFVAGSDGDHQTYALMRRSVYGREEHVCELSHRHAYVTS